MGRSPEAVKPARPRHVATLATQRVRAPPAGAGTSDAARKTMVTVARRNAAGRDARAGESTAAGLVPSHPSLPSLREAAAGCRACPLWERGTQTVFGEGAARSDVLLLGEQPGDREDLAGKPFVGPAGQLLDRALEAAGIDRGRAYVTNVVKHFKWEPRGKRRIHKKPDAREIRACLPWLAAEIAVVQPEIVVCLGATAAQALLGSSFRVTRDRGRILESPLAPRTLATVHPASILRMPDEDSRQAELSRFIEDLTAVARALG
ncbi:UdgX family uracil-DNA binding protein [Sorangium sp. So ce321]|uniref:UdgX family uracil-DNA binding protein n=1 Tax=Sorangium sp. So ce321 TaxID=3133300 RepID=UPI003F5E842A